MSTRSVAQWQEILSGLSPKDAAQRVLGDIIHYMDRRSYYDDDQCQLANALLAFNAQALAALMVERDAEWNKALEAAAFLIATQWTPYPSPLCDKIRSLRRPDAPANTEMPGEDVKSVTIGEAEYDYLRRASDEWDSSPDEIVGDLVRASMEEHRDTEDEPALATPTIEELRAKVVEALLQCFGSSWTGKEVSIEFERAEQAGEFQDAFGGLQAAQQPGGA